ncbi:14105_t:CDS:2, partial [Acaulospora colombiana]
MSNNGQEKAARAEIRSYDKRSNTITYDPSNRKNRGLEKATNELEKVRLKCQWSFSNADLWTLAGAVSIEMLSGSRLIIPWVPGRKDGGIEGEELLPGLKPSEIRRVFNRMGFADREIVALMGAHTVGRCHLENSGIDGQWTVKNNIFTNEYLASQKNQSGQNIKDNEAYRVPEMSTIMLSTDMALFDDPEFKKIVAIYANNQERFFADFKEAFGKLLSFGVSQQGSVMPQEGAQYNIFEINELYPPSLSTVQLTFSDKLPYISSLSFTGSGKDVVGPYTINNGYFDPSSSSGTITFTKSYTNRDLTWIYRGCYNHELFFGKWGDNNQHSFIIRRASGVETRSLTGNWGGYYFYDVGYNNDRMSIDLRFCGGVNSLLEILWTEEWKRDMGK